MVYPIKRKKGRPKKEEKYRTLKNYKALKGFSFDRIKRNKVYFKKKEKIKKD